MPAPPGSSDPALGSCVDISPQVVGGLWAPLPTMSLATSGAACSVKAPVPDGQLSFLDTPEMGLEDTGLSFDPSAQL